MASLDLSILQAIVRLCLVCVMQGHGEEGGRGQGVQRGTHAAPTKPGHFEGRVKLEAAKREGERQGEDEREGRSRHRRGILSVEGGHGGSMRSFMGDQMGVIVFTHLGCF